MLSFIFLKKNYSGGSVVFKDDVPPKKCNIIDYGEYLIFGNRNDFLEWCQYINEYADLNSFIRRFRNNPNNANVVTISYIVKCINNRNFDTDNSGCHWMTTPDDIISLSDFEESFRSMIFLQHELMDNILFTKNSDSELLLDSNSNVEQYSVGNIHE